jgi:hypothetical protein
MQRQHLRLKKFIRVLKNYYEYKLKTKYYATDERNRP